LTRGARRPGYGGAEFLVAAAAALASLY